MGCVQGSPSGPLLFSQSINNVAGGPSLGEIACCADDSYLTFEGDSWDEIWKIAGAETVNAVDWLKTLAWWRKQLQD